MAHELINVPDAVIAREAWKKKAPHRCMKYRPCAQQAVKILLFTVFGILFTVNCHKVSGICPEQLP